MRVGSETQIPAASRGALVVDDDWVVRSTVGRCLRRDGHRVWEASSGAEALRIADAEGDAIGVALLDIYMDGMGGFESAVRLRSSHPHIHIVYMTGDTRAGLLRMRAPVLHKPFTPRELRVTVRLALDGVRGTPPQTE